MKKFLGLFGDVFGRFEELFEVSLDNFLEKFLGEGVAFRAGGIGDRGGWSAFRVMIQD